ncbi:MAG: DNA repair protein RadA [Oscillospiraceae bacterium]
MKSKTSFFCTECGNETPKWAGKCPACGAWNTLVEGIKTKSGGPARPAAARRTVPQRMDEVGTQEEIRFKTGISELDRVLGGGAVRGSMVLIGGAPGIGKSTLLMQVCGLLSRDEKILYVSGEESQRQLKMRAQRLGVENDNLYVLPETNLEEILESSQALMPDIMIVDSVQTLYNSELSSAPGSVSQVRECTMAIMQMSKSQGITTFVVGHINKDGAIAGPKVLEHMVDCVLYFEGERSMSHRILRAAKNRFGSTNEIGVFEMLDTGLRAVDNPSEMLLSGRPVNAPGTCVACVMEGSRPILAEIQALVTPTVFSAARRNANGIDYNRTLLLMAVLEKRGGLSVSGSDAYLNVIGGLELDEPAADLATILAIASSHLDRPVGSDVVAVGEIGLTGEVRSVNALEQRLCEVARLGFRRCVIPAHVRGEVRAPDALELISVKNVREAIAAVLY